MPPPSCARRSASKRRSGSAATPAAIEIVGRDEGGRARRQVRRLGWARAEGISAEGAFLNKKHTYTYGAHAAHVAVDAKIGHVELIDYVAVEDVRPHHQSAHRARADHRLASCRASAARFWSISSTTTQGQLLTGSLADYLHSDRQRLPQHPRDRRWRTIPRPINPLGAKGAGEGGIIAVGGVMANAVANALRSLGVEPRELPLSPTKIWEMVQTARK